MIHILLEHSKKTYSALNIKIVNVVFKVFGLSFSNIGNCEVIWVHTVRVKGHTAVLGNRDIKILRLFRSLSEPKTVILF